MFLIYAIKSNLLKLAVCILLFFYMTNPLKADDADSLFHTDEILNLELRSDFSSIDRGRADNPEYHDGELIYYPAGSEPLKFSVRVMARGNFRRSPVNCSFPPLFIDFSKSEVKNTVFSGQDRLKLVTPCQNEEDVIDEYIIYKMYNQVTDLSFKVRLVKILYFDTSLDKVLFEKHSFFLEDKDHLAERNIAVERDMYITPYDLDRDNVKKMSLFQYLIGNKDWFVTSRQNIVILQPEDSSMVPYAVPYDFDFSGFVNAQYTKPRGVPDNALSDRRVYKGICFTENEFNEIFDFYRKLKPVFESIIKNQDLLSKRSKRQIINYIRQFYSIIRYRELVRLEFLDVCQTKKDYNIPD